MGIRALYGRYIASLQENSGVIQSLKLSKDSPGIFVLPESEFYLEGKSDKSPCSSMNNLSIPVFRPAALGRVFVEAVIVPFAPHVASTCVQIESP